MPVLLQVAGMTAQGAGALRQLLDSKGVTQQYVDDEVLGRMAMNLLDSEATLSAMASLPECVTLLTSVPFCLPVVTAALIKVQFSGAPND